MALDPELLFPKIRNLGDKSFGRVYFASYSSAGDFLEWFQYNDIVVCGLSGLDPSIHTSKDNGLRYTLITYPNEVSLQIRFFCGVYPGTEVEYVKVSYGHYFEGTYYQIDEVPTSDHNTVSAAKYFGAKVGFIVEYAMESAVEDITKARAIMCHLMVPTQEGSAMQSWSHIAGSHSYQLTYENGIGKDWEGNPTSICYDLLGVYPIGFYIYEDMETLKDIIEDIEPLPDDVPWYDDIDPTPNPDPSQEDNPSETGGGTGYGPSPGPGGGPTGGRPPGTDPYDPTSDPVDFPPLPSHGAVDCGAVKVFAVSNGILTQIFNKLWNSGIFDIATWQKLMQCPLDALVGLQVVPITPTTSGTAPIKLGSFDTVVDAPVVTQQYYSIDFGSVTINEYWGSALDYSPYTTFEIYLPAVGMRELQIDDTMGLTLSVRYNYDIITGELVANVKCGKSVLYKFNGNIKGTIPVSSVTNTQLEAALRALPTGAAAASGAGAAGAMVGAALNVAMSKRVVQRAGDISGSVALLDDFTPYVIVHRPIQSLAKDFKTFKGYPSNITATLSTLSGYTEVEYVHLTGIDGATDEELKEIERLLKSGVII